MNKLLTIDSTLCSTELCELGVKYPTDKSPLNTNNHLYKHAYTAIYNLLFSSLKYKPIRLSEIGIYHNMSMRCWREFFPNATLYGLEYNQDFINNALEHNLNNTFYSIIDVTNKQSIKAAFNNLEHKMDIIIDDSTHQPLHQINIIQTCLDYLNSGGYLVIEDLFKSVDIELFSQILNNMTDFVADYFFVDANHKNRYSVGWDNDRLLIIIRR